MDQVNAQAKEKSQDPEKAVKVSLFFCGLIINGPLPNARLSPLLLSNRLVQG